MRRIKINKFKYWQVIFLFSILSAFDMQSFGAEPPFLESVKVVVEVNLNTKTKIYAYKYTITNSLGSKGNLVGFDVDIKKPEGGTNLSRDGLTYGKGYLKRTSEGILSMSTIPPMVMVGIQSPDGWIAGFSKYGTVSLGGGDFVQLKPGQSLSGFELNSYGLPSIREYKGEPALDTDAEYYPDWESVEGAKDETAAMRTKIKELIERVSFKGKTIGPTAPPADFKPAAFLDYIIDLKHQASSLGWIDNSGIVNSLDAKLDNAKKKMIQGENNTAKNILNAFINDVEAQGCSTYVNCPPGKHLTSEAYALLKFNAQYLIDNLK